MIATQHDGTAATVQQRSERLLDLAAHLGTRAAQRHVAHVRECAIPAEVDGRFRPGIAGGRVQRLADDGRSGGRAP
jgi:hypothetical protein